MENGSSPNWELFEKNATSYLNQHIGIKGVSFKGEGGSNSTDTDIFVYFKGKRIFTIEAKKSPSGQLYSHEYYCISK